MKKLTYVSLFSSAGVGCFGFKDANFECVATSELIERRLDIQKANNKCKYNSGYIGGDITLSETQDKIRKEILLWKEKEKVNQIDVVIATPPCQGMSVANHHKTEDDKTRNSLVVESIKIVNEIKPKFFVFENVKAFLKTVCTYEENDILIGELIHSVLGGDYNIFSQVINFKDYGVPSSRTRTLVIGVNKQIKDVSPFFLFPDKQENITLKQAISKFNTLNIMGEVDSNDIYHSFRPYPEYMRDWIKYLKPGQNAFEHNIEEHKPYKVVNGEKIRNQQKNSDKYKRNEWDKVCPCIHTRNDQLASQATVHPVDDRVLSIRELMAVMTIPNNFRWVVEEEFHLNSLSYKEKKDFLKKNEMKIRQSIGEAVPTSIFKQIANKISVALDLDDNHKNIKKIIEDNSLLVVDNLKDFLKKESQKDNLFIRYPLINKIVELCNDNKEDFAAYYTRPDIIFPLISDLPDIKKDKIKILEPSVGFGAFLPSLIKKYEGKELEIDVLDIDPKALDILKIVVNSLLSSKVKINFINSDFLLYNTNIEYDLIVGNPPYKNLKINEVQQYLNIVNTKETKNIFAYFIEKSLKMSKNLSFVIPKSFLYTSEFEYIRSNLNKNNILKIVDYGEKAFQGVKIETIGLIISQDKKDDDIIIESYITKSKSIKSSKYIFDNKYPTWLIYRDNKFDEIASKMKFNIFDVFRDRQISKKMCSLEKIGKEDFIVLKAENITPNGISFKEEQYYLNNVEGEKTSVFKFVEKNKNRKFFIAPNMTYYPRMNEVKSIANYIFDGSCVLFITKNEKDEELINTSFYHSDDFKYIWRIAQNYGTRSLNIDKNNAYYWGILDV